jgi:hypothetical protein
MDNNSKLGLTQTDLNQLEMATSALEKQLVLGARSVQSQSTHVFSNLNVDFFDFKDIEISYFGV